MTLAEKTSALGSVPVFAGLSQSSLKRVARLASEFEAPAGQILIEPDATGSGMFVLLDGTVSVHVRGKEPRDLEAGAFFGELALLTPAARRTARVRAKTDVRCLAIDRGDFQKLLVAEPKIALALLETLATRLVAQETGSARY